MTLIELLFFIAAIVCAIIGANHFGQFGVPAGIAGGLVGLTIPFVLGRILAWFDDLRFSRTREGRRLRIAEVEFDKKHTEKRVRSWRRRPQAGKDGSIIVTIFYGGTIPPRRAFFRFSGDSMDPVELSGAEVQNYIDVPMMR
ncbi:hypothetical protein [Haloferula sp.]|uniref:hypothetical protein n=1 Tax=Haloferula sp. TaxID=2497595 RepID=UPI003C74AA3F